MQAETLYVLLSALLVHAQNEINGFLPKDVKVKPRENSKNLSSQQWEEIARKVSNLSLDFTPTGRHKQPDISGESGISVINYQIIGGSIANRGFFPWQVGLTTNNKLFCGGSLISSNWVLTAAHCADGTETFDIIFGGSNLKSKEAGRVMITTTTQFMHPEYDAENIVNDLALLKLPTPVTFNKWIHPIRLPRKSDAKKSFAGVTTTISGWGLTRDFGNTSSKLKYVKLQVIPNSVCAKTFDFIEPSTLCTSGASKQGTCNGDSGGPLVHRDRDGKFTQIGIVSFGLSSCEEKGPSAFARVSSFLGWISSTTGIEIRH